MIIFRRVSSIFIRRARARERPKPTVLFFRKIFRSVRPVCLFGFFPTYPLTTTRHATSDFPNERALPRLFRVRNNVSVQNSRQRRQCCIIIIIIICIMRIVTRTVWWQKAFGKSRKQYINFTSQSVSLDVKRIRKLWATWKSNHHTFPTSFENVQKELLFFFFYVF